MRTTRRELGSLTAAALWSLGRAHGQQPNSSRRAPNVVVILCDDLGYGDLGCYGNRVIRTPNIDGLASEGVRLTDFYATPTCTPSRACLLTGRYPVRSGLTRVLIPRESFGVPDSELTLAEALSGQGYKTACIGKWHLGDRPAFRPNRHGFDYFYGLLYSNDMTLPLVHWPAIKLFRNTTPIESPAMQRTLTQRFTGEALQFIEGAGNDPFLLYLAYSMPHLPWSASKDFAGKSKHGLYGDAVEEIDWSVGEMMQRISRQGLERDTLIVFASDNGPELAAPGPGGSAGGLRGGKGTTWEGGLRVPGILRWPGRLPAGSTAAGVCSLMDIFATAAVAGGADLGSRVVDGVDLMPYLEGRSPSPRSALCHFHRGTLFAIRHERWKLHFVKIDPGPKGRLKPAVACSPPELYDLVSDPGETRNVSAVHPEVADRLQRLAESHRASIAAGRPPPSALRSLLPNRRQKK